MTEEISTNWNLSFVTTADGIYTTQIVPGGNSEGIILKCVVILMGIVGTIGNALILYALVASKQHKKHALIVNQNALDLFSSFFLVVVYAVFLGNIYLKGVSGFWICILFHSEMLIWWGTNGSMVNLGIITIDRYLKVVHAVWSRKHLKPWMVYSAMASSWFVGIAWNTLLVFFSTEMEEGVCYSYLVKDDLANWFLLGWYILFFYVIVLILFIFCYGRILISIRRQAKVMAGHNANAANAAQSQSNQIQSNVIKTMILVSAFYALSWLPYNVWTLFSSSGIIPISFGDSGYFVTSFLAFFYTSANPFIYATKFNPVREVLKKMLPCKSFKKSSVNG